MSTDTDFSKFPKWLFATEGPQCNRQFVVHCEEPRFVMEIQLGPGAGIPTWIDLPIFDPAKGEPEEQKAELIRAAVAFFKSNSY